MPFINEEEINGMEPIAIVGMACRLPGAIDSPSKFWQTLREKRSVKTPKVPSSRFNIDGHYHPDLSRPGSYSALGGYFLDGDPVDFDPSFFNMTPIEAQWLDPQQRKMLEVCYEVFENAGITLDEVAGSNTGVYAATFTSDYQQMSIFERDFRHNYAATGVDPGIISNRINNVFDLNGPSMVLNTACSSGLYAIHNACHALRSRDCEAAIAAGSNLIMMVDQQMNTAKLGVLSPTSECHTFDERADGYGRAEAVGALYLKRFSDAIRDQNVIRGVIRTSAVNTNGKVEGMGITFPNASGQERVLRQAYTKANLDPNQTAYLECHGTGTPTGDPIEVEAVSRGMNDRRDRDKPLLLGAAKANIGHRSTEGEKAGALVAHDLSDRAHSEAASGIFATMKAALMTENAEIPGVYGLKKLNPNIKEEEWNVKIASELMPWPADFDVRRASVSSFGYGGTNAHLVVEAVESIYRRYEHGEAKQAARYTYDDGSIDRPFLITMSAHDKKTLVCNIKAHQDIVGDYFLPDLAYTLNERRTKFAGARAYTIAWPGSEVEAFQLSAFSYGSRLSFPKRDPMDIGFVLTGQGSQWARMGCEAMRRYPLFTETLIALDQVLQRTVQSSHRPSWSLLQELQATMESSRLAQPEISQPACTAVQIAIIDLFASWNIKPSVTVGHSSGEIAAAYAAGRISAPEAILAAYFRGQAVLKAAPAGTMLAIGLGVTEVQEYVDMLMPEVANRIAIACENSSRSVTLSGSHADIDAIKMIMDDHGVFSRPLKTGKAYHSPQMDNVAPLYEKLYAEAYMNLTELDLFWKKPIVSMISSVTGSQVESSQLGISYWCENLRGKVRFDTALRALGRDVELASVKMLVEIGPHSALKSPVMQTITENRFDLAYTGSLVRDQDDAVALLKTAGELYLKGFDIEYNTVNSLNSVSRSPVGQTVKDRSLQGRCLVDLPPYQWNYDRQHWYEPRAVADLRTSKQPRHDLLGRRIFGLSGNAPTWRNILRQRDVAWFSHHTLGTDVVFPAAGHISLAIEAILQQLDIDPTEVGGVQLSNIDIQKALIIPDSDEGIEVHSRLEKDLKSDNWYSFAVESVASGSKVWTLHSKCKIRTTPTLIERSGICPYQSTQLHQKVTPKRWYRSLERVGFRYGPCFQTMTQEVRANGKDRCASAGINVKTKQTELESRYMLHPATIDGCLHIIIAAVHRGLHKEMPWGLVPLSVEDLSLTFPSSATELDNNGRCTAWVDSLTSSRRHFLGNAQLFASASSKCLMDIRNLKMVAYEAALPPTSIEASPRKPFTTVTWKPFDTAHRHLKENAAASSAAARRVLLIHHDLASLALPEDVQSSSVPLQACSPEHWENCDCIVVDDSCGSILAHATEVTWTILKTVVLQPGKPIVWVTRGANDGRSTNSGIPQGFLRAVRSEMPGLRISLLDADTDASADTISTLIQYQLAALEISTQDMDIQQEAEYWLTKDSQVLVPRLESSTSLNSLFDDRDLEYDFKTILADKSYTSRLINDRLVWEISPELQHLKPFQVEIQVQLAEFTKADLSARGEKQRARIVQGQILRTGSGLEETDLKGRAVVGYTDRKSGIFLDTRLVTSAFVVLSERESQSVGLLSSLIELAAAVDALDLNNPEELTGKRVVIVRPGTTSPFEKAARKLGSQLGFQVSTIIDVDVSNHIQRLVPSANIVIITGSPNVEVVREVWQAMPEQSSFVFSGDTLVEEYGPLDAQPFAKGVRLRTCGNSPRATIQKTMAIVNSFSDSNRPTLVGVDVQDVLESVESVGRSMNGNIGSEILRIKYGESKTCVRKPRVQRTQFSPDGAYILVGCLGGLGRSLTNWMQERGCMNFVFLSRSGATKPEAAEVVDRLIASNARVRVFSVDASDEKAVADIVRRVSQTSPIKGVVHAAMVLRDGLYENMTFADYQAVLRPKIQGAIALDKALAGTKLDFFLMTSSISAVLGNMGQSNYSAANNFLDYLALCRRRNGLAACSIALPMVEDVGVVAENDAVAEALARKMPFSINEKEMLEGFEAAILHGQPSNSQSLQLGDVQLVLGLEPKAMLNAMEDNHLDLSDLFWHRDARMSSIRTSLEAEQKDIGRSLNDQGSKPFTATLHGLSEDEILITLGEYIVERTARILGLEPNAFQADGVSVANHGVDSMIGVELQRWLFKEFGLQVSIGTISDPNTTFAGLACTVARHLRLIQDQG